MRIFEMGYTLIFIPPVLFFEQGHIMAGWFCSKDGNSGKYLFSASKIISVLLLFSLVHFFSVVFASPSLFSEAEECLLKGDYITALNIYDTAIQKKLNSSRAHRGKAKIYWMKGETEKALDEINSAIKDAVYSDTYFEEESEKEAEAQAYYTRGMIYVSSGKKNLMENAVNDFNKSIDRKPDFYDAYIAKARYYIEVKPDYHNALLPLLKAKGIDFDRYDAFYWHAALLYKIQKAGTEFYNEELIEEIEIALAMKPPEKEKQILNEWKSEIQERAKAKAAIKFAGKPDYIVAEEFYNHEKYEQAIQSYEKCLKTEPYDIGALENLALSYEEIKDYESAIKTYEVIISTLTGPLDYLNYFYFRSIGYDYAYLKNYKKAIEYFTKTLKLNPEETYSLINRGFCYGKIGELDLSLKDSLAGHRIESDDWISANNIAISYYNKGELKESEKWIKRAINLKPDDSVPYFNYATLLRKINKKKLAEKEFKKVMEIEIKNTSIDESVELSGGELLNLIASFSLEKPVRQNIYAKIKFKNARKEYFLDIEFKENKFGASAEKEYYGYAAIPGNIQKGVYDISLKIFSDPTYSTLLSQKESLFFKSANWSTSIAFLYYMENDYESAKFNAEKATEIDSESGDAYYIIGMISEKENKPGKAIEYYKKAIEIYPISTEVYINLAKLYIKQQQYKEASDKLNYVLTKLAPNNKEAKNLLILCENKLRKKN